MSIATNSNSLANRLNAVLQGQLASMLGVYPAIGTMLRQATVTTLRRCNPNAAATAGANPYIVAGQGVAETVQQSTLNYMPGNPPATLAAGQAVGANLTSQLPDDCKADVVLRATAIAGTGTLGTLTVDTQATNDTNFATGGSGPAQGHVGVSPSGDIVANATDAWTSLDVTYVPAHQDCAEATLTVASNSATLPTAWTAQGVVMLMEVTSLAGTTTGNFAVLPPASSNPGATKQANLNLGKTAVLFKSSDAVTSCRVKVGLVSAVCQNQLLELAIPFGV